VCFMPHAALAMCFRIFCLRDGKGSGTNSEQRMLRSKSETFQQQGGAVRLGFSRVFGVVLGAIELGMPVT
jgi:hypothetical protein